jgi:putative ABC transport system permease protein
MIGLEITKYSLKNLWNRKFRSFLTVLSIFVGITTIFIFMSFGLGLYNYVNELTSSSSADKIMVQAKGVGIPGLDDTIKLTDKDLKAVENSQGVFEATGVYFKVAEIKNGKEKIYSFVIGYDPSIPVVMDVFNIEIESGRELKKGDSGKVVLGYNYMIKDKIFSTPLNVGDSIEIQGKKLRIIGFFESVGTPQDDSQVYVINEIMKDLYSEENLSYGMIIGRVDVKNIDEVVEKVEKDLRKSRDVEKGKEDFFVQSFDDLIESYSIIINVILGFILLIALISVLVSAINTANTVITSVIERVREIGVMKAIGAKNSEIFQVLLLESSILGFIAGVLGVIVGSGITFITGLTLENLGYGFLKPYYSIWLYVGCILFATITGSISGAWPAWKASKIKPVDALRYE